MSEKTGIIIPAAGVGKRMKLDHPKQYHHLAGTPILIHTVRSFAQIDRVDQIVVVVPPDMLEQTVTLLSRYQLADIEVTAGGKRRQDSVYAGLIQIRDDIDIILVHDGARPFLQPDLIKRCIEGVQQHGAVIAAIPVKDTLKSEKKDHLIDGTVDREGLWQAQTPQGARKNLLLQAFTENGDRDVTDEAGLLEFCNIDVTLVEGSEKNIKITRPEDLQLGEMIMNSSQPTQAIRIGHGFDAHQFAENRPLVLGGVTIEHEFGLAGHSDADVLTHALCDAILGAAALGDIGKHFPDTSEQYKDIYSIKLLEQVIKAVQSKGFVLGNADITVICQAPKLAPHIQKMEQIIADACKVASTNINIKATTTEKMGYTGRGEGISCHAVALLNTI